MNRFSDIEVLVHVVEHGSYTAAARELGISKSYASKQIRALEERLGVRLLHRTTRTVSPTDAGRVFVQRCAAVIEELEEAERAVSALQDSPRGTLRLSAPVSFGTRYIAPLLAGFMNDYPDLHVVLDLSDRTVDLIDEGYDLALRIGRLDDSSLIARRLAPIRAHVVASPDYLSASSQIHHPDHLRDHPCMVYSLQPAPTCWSFTKTGAPPHEEPVRVRVNPRLTSNNGDALLDAVLAGNGVAALPDFFVGQLLREGRLVSVLSDWDTMPGAGLWAIYPPGRFLAAKVRLLLEHLADRLDPTPWSV
ncbi:MAG: LysR family transcriptional regulator [Deltaproteobacteria bacterium]|nr:MAG: LysR family transcriptional regulator [Deltaproteobacteria bacterium]